MLRRTIPGSSSRFFCFAERSTNSKFNERRAAGEVVTETLEYEGGRQVTTYIPSGKPEAVVFAGDGQLISQWGALLETAGVPPTMIVGVHRVEDETLRLHEYSPGFAPERFAAHEGFFVEKVQRWARSRFGIALASTAAHSGRKSSRAWWRGHLRDKALRFELQQAKTSTGR